MNKKVIIIGGVAGGATTAARLRRLDERAEIIIMEKGKYISYANCGLPYYIGDVIEERAALLLQTPEVMKQRFNIEVRTENEVIAIDQNTKTITVKQHQDGKEYKEHYDKLVIATGSNPIVPPIEGIQGEGIFTLWNIPDTDKIKEYLVQKKPKTAAVIGGGFIGLEMAENLKAAGCDVTVIEMQDQVMAPVDFEMAQLVQENMEMNGVDLILSDGVTKFQTLENSSGGNATKITLASGKEVVADMVILSIGIRPNSILAKEAGLELNPKGGILVEDSLRTSNEDIYAVGDVIEITEFVEQGKTMIPLAGPANKQARICANNLAKELNEACENKENAEPLAHYEGTQGTSVAKVFDLTVAATGLNEKILNRLGKVKDQDYFVATISQKSHAGYYPGAAPLTLKLIFAPEGKIFGAQIVGQEGVDKRIDVIATAMRLGASVAELEKLELAYAPPYSSAKDPVNMLGYVANNMIKGMVKIVSWDALEDRNKLAAQEGVTGVTVLDVSEEFERMVFAMEDSYHIPFGQIRERMTELDREHLIVAYCAIGVRAYNVSRILKNTGFKHVAIYPAGANFYKSLFRKKLYKAEERSTETVRKDWRAGMEFTEKAAEAMAREKGELLEDSITNENGVSITRNLDCSGLQCPGPIMRVFSTINEIQTGQVIKVAATDMGFARDIDAWCKRTGNTLLKAERVEKQNIVYIQKGQVGKGEEKQECNLQGSMELPQGKTLVVFSGDLDKVLASFIIANGAAAMGRSVTMFFTFWGLNALRKTEKQHVKKPVIDRMFGMMMPRGTSKLSLSNMNMGGMGTKMMKKVMKDKNVDSLEALMKSALENGIKLVACTMSMDVMGITKEELIEGVEYAGVAAYLGDAEQSNVNLFI